MKVKPFVFKTRSFEIEIKKQCNIEYGIFFFLLWKCYELGKVEWINDKDFFMLLVKIWRKPNLDIEKTKMSHMNMAILEESIDMY